MELEGNHPNLVWGIILAHAEETEEHHHVNQSVGPNLNLEPPKYEAGMIPIWMWYLMFFVFRLVLYLFLQCYTYNISMLVGSLVGFIINSVNFLELIWWRLKCKHIKWIKTLYRGLDRKSKYCHECAKYIIKSQCVRFFDVLNSFWGRSRTNSRSMMY